jgi:hypothetical protein
MLFHVRLLSKSHNANRTSERPETGMDSAVTLKVILLAKDLFWNILSDWVDTWNALIWLFMRVYRFKHMYKLITFPAELTVQAFKHKHCSLIFCLRWILFRTNCYLISGGVQVKLRVVDTSKFHQKHSRQCLQANLWRVIGSLSASSWKEKSMFWFWQTSTPSGSMSSSKTTSSLVKSLPSISVASTW